MDDHAINEEWSQQMPSPDVAWGNMRAKLNKEMPVESVLYRAGTQKYFANKNIYLVVLLLVLMNIKDTRKNNSISSLPSLIRKPSPAGVNMSDQPIQGTLKNTQSLTIGSKEIKNNDLKDKRVAAKHATNYKRDILNTTPALAVKKSNTVAERNEAAIQDSAATFINKENVALTNKENSNKKTKIATLQPTDSSQSSDEEKEEALSVQAGLQWTLPIPIAGTQNYFAGPSANAQAWRILLPGVWISFRTEKDLFMAEVNPFAVASFNPKSFYNSQVADSVAILERFKSITKVFGISGAISYQHNIINCWWAGGGLQANFWSKGMAVVTVKKQDNNTNVSTSSAQSYVLNKDDWQYFSKFQVYPHVQLMYRTPAYQAGLRAGVALMPLAKERGAKNLLLTEFFFRLPLISNGKKVKL